MQDTFSQRTTGLWDKTVITSILDTLVPRRENPLNNYPSLLRTFVWLVRTLGEKQDDNISGMKFVQWWKVWGQDTQMGNNSWKEEPEGSAEDSGRLLWWEGPFGLPVCSPRNKTSKKLKKKSSFSQKMT